MIIAVLNDASTARHASVACQLAAVRAHAGRNVLLMHAPSARCTKPAAGSWDLVEMKLGASARVSQDDLIHAELAQLASRYDDVVIDAGTRDTAGSRAALDRAAVAVIPILGHMPFAGARKRLAARIEAARAGNPALRLLIISADSKGVQPAHDPDALRLFGAQLRPSRIIRICADTGLAGHGSCHPDAAAHWSVHRSAWASQVYRHVFAA